MMLDYFKAIKVKRENVKELARKQGVRNIYENGSESRGVPLLSHTMGMGHKMAIATPHLPAGVPMMPTAPLIGKRLSRNDRRVKGCVLDHHPPTGI